MYHNKINIIIFYKLIIAYFLIINEHEVFVNRAASALCDIITNFYAALLMLVSELLKHHIFVRN